MCRSIVIAQSFLGIVRFFNSMYINILWYARLGLSDNMKSVVFVKRVKSPIYIFSLFD